MKKARLGELLRTDGFKRRDKSKRELSYFDTSSITRGVIGEPKMLTVGIDKIPSRAQHSIDGETIVYSLVRPLNEHHAFVTPDIVPENSVFSTGYSGIKERANNDLYYLYLLLTSESSLARLAQIASTSTSSYPSINPSDIENLVVDYHDDLTYQTQISSFGKTIDRLIGNLNTQIVELEQTAQDLYDYWFVQFDFPDENGNPYRSSGGKMVWNDQLKQEIPAGWRVASVGELSFQASKSISARKLSDQIVEHYSIPAYDKDCFPEISVGSSIKSSKTIVKAGDILVSKLNPQFQRIWLPMTSDKLQVCSTEFIAVRPNHPSLRSLLNRIAKSRRFYETLVAAATSSTGSRSRVNPEVIISYKFACNDDMTLLSALSSHDEQIEVLRKQKQELVRLRDTLIPLLLNGQATFRSDYPPSSGTDV